MLFLITRKKWRYYFNAGISPTVIYSVIWGIVWLIHFINPLDYRAISNLAVFYSLVPLYAIYFGEKAGYPSLKPVIIRPYRIPNKHFKTIILSLDIIVFVLGVLMFGATYFIYGSFWESGGGAELKNARSTLGSVAYSSSQFGSIAKYFNVIQGIATVLFIFGLLYNYQNKSKSRLIIILPILSTLLFGISWAARAQIANLFIIYLSYLFIPKREDVQKLFSLKILILFSILMVFIILITSSTRIINTIEVNGREYSRTLIQSFDYSAGPLIAFDVKVKDATSTYGRLSFNGIESLLRMMKIVSAPVPKEFFKLEGSTVPVQNNFTYLRTINTYSWLLYLFYDFNIFGLFIIPFLISFIYTRQSLKLLYYRDKFVVRGAFLILLLLILFSSTATFLFRNFEYVVSFVFLGIFYLYEKKHSFYK